MTSTQLRRIAISGYLILVAASAVATCFAFYFRALAPVALYDANLEIFRALPADQATAVTSTSRAHLSVLTMVVLAANLLWAASIGIFLLVTRDGCARAGSN